MKNQLLTFFALAFTFAAFAQPTLTYENHRLLPDANNPMTLCEYMEPGTSGAEKIWDFSQIVAKNEFVGRIISAYNEEEFGDANTKLIEFTTSFFFDIDESGIYQVGYASQDNKTQVKYEQPFEKLKFPFTYKDNYATSFSGNYLYNGKSIGDIDGNGVIEADAWGELKLPNETVYTNTVRVKTEKNYTITYSPTSSTTVEILTYRWYNDVHRYPLLVLTEYKTFSNSKENISYQAAYNINAVNSSGLNNKVLTGEKVTLYPNPTNEELFLNIEAEDYQSAKLAIIDVTGKTIINDFDVELVPGENSLDLSDEMQSLTAGTYLLRIKAGEQLIIKELSVSNKY